MSTIVLRGDARSLPLPDESVDLIVTSPPYWSLRDYRDGGRSLAGQIGAEETWQEYIANLLDCTREWVRVLKPSGSIFVVIGDKYSERSGPGHPDRGDGTVGFRAERPRRKGPGLTGVPAKSLIGLPWRYALACVDELGLINRRDNIWHKTSGMPESVTDRCATRHEYGFHLTRSPSYFAAVDEIREPHTMKPQRRPRGRKPGPDLGTVPAQTHSASQRDEPGVDGHPLGGLPGSVWGIASAPLNVPAHIEHARCCGGQKQPGCNDGTDHHAAFPPALARKAILGWSPSGICTGCGEARQPVATAIGLDMNRPQARRAHQLAQRAGLTEDHLAALLAVGVSDTGRGAATQIGTGRNTDGVYALADEARAALGGYAREYLLRRPTRFGYACDCTPFTDHPGTGRPTSRRDYNPGQPGYSPQGTYGQKQAGEYERVGPWREYHFAGWVPAPTRPAVVLDPFGGTGTTAMVADVLGRTGIAVDLSADYCHLAQWRTRDPAERARALGVPKPPPVPDGQMGLDFEGVA
jgi:DNA modification methylase